MILQYIQFYNFIGVIFRISKSSNKVYKDLYMPFLFLLSTEELHGRISYFFSTFKLTTNNNNNYK